MNHPLSPLHSRPRKPLLLEWQQGCLDRAVTGGMYELMQAWAEEMVRDDGIQAGPWAVQLAMRFSDYVLRSPEERQEIVRAMLRELGVAEEAFPAVKQPPRERPLPTGLVAWEDPVTALDGVGPQRAGLLQTIGIETVGDLLCYYPRGYEDRGNLATLADARHREPLMTRVTVTESGRVEYRNQPRAIIPARDRTGACKLVWINQGYMIRQYARGDVLLIKGQARCYPSGLEILVLGAERLPPEAADDQGVTPLYATMDGVSEPMLRGLIHQALTRCPEIPPGLVPQSLAEKRGLLPLSAALPQAHRPETLAQAQEAQSRLAHECLFAMQADLAQRRRLFRQGAEGSRIPVTGVAETWAAALPFTLTGAQERSIREILADLEADYPAQRLLHGDVGSGKTAVAGAALLAAARAGRQAALMAPTEMLAEQHYQVLSRLLGPLGVSVQLLTAGAVPVEAAQVRASLATGATQVAVGTHALFQSGVSFRDLALVIVDEQHRFGVRQRAELTAKGASPNLLVMSATPIPRTLALTAYGDFEVSVLDELPPGRQKVYTQVIPPKQRRQAYQAIQDHAVHGGRSFIVCAVIEEAKANWMIAAEDHFQHLRNMLPALRWGLVHGRMPSPEREKIMDSFRQGGLDALVATSVVEVGVDVPEATLMLVENAERFGLAQLHQLRGRVARSRQPARCFLITGSPNPEVIERLQVLERTNDGFEIAQQDLLRRGPGELFGERQHGYVDMRLVEAAADTRRLAQVREDAFAVLEADPDLARPEHQPLRQYLERTAQRREAWTL
jgi:ATP-dependent DNA helicase RecG